MKTKQAKHEYAVIVGNIGYVYTGTDLWEAEMHYSDYVQLSSEKYGRGACIHHRMQPPMCHA